MKLLAILLVLVFFILLAALVVRGMRALALRALDQKEKNRGWAVSPRTTIEGHREAWLICPGEKDFFVGRDAHGNDSKWDEILLEAEVQSNEFNRLRAQGRRELKLSR